ncbi:MAG: hypothetical protein JOY80_04315 [Candidatus Dormibacteraeota bacterium]|nr:hypothetical protein [Candidatus Dormibacteraeota bacterium]
MTARCGRAGLLAACLLVLTACDAFPLQHSETACVYPGQTVVLKTQTNPGVHIVYRVHDDFGNNIGPTLFTTSDQHGDAMVSWKTPASLPFTTIIHFLLTATSTTGTDTRDIHVVEGGGGRQC